MTVLVVHDMYAIDTLQVLHFPIKGQKYWSEKEFVSFSPQLFMTVRKTNLASSTSSLHSAVLGYQWEWKGKTIKTDYLKKQKM